MTAAEKIIEYIRRNHNSRSDELMKLIAEYDGERAIAESQAPQPPSNDLLHKITDELTRDLQPLYTTMSPIPIEQIRSLIAMKLLELAQHEYGQAFEFLNRPVKGK